MSCHANAVAAFPDGRFIVAQNGVVSTYEIPMVRKQLEEKAQADKARRAAEEKERVEKADAEKARMEEQKKPDVTSSLANSGMFKNNNQTTPAEKKPDITKCGACLIL